MQILIIKTSSLGDIVHTFPVLNFIKRHFRLATIDFVVEKPLAELVINHPLVDNVIFVETKKWRKNLSEGFKELRNLKDRFRQKEYDVSFDLQCNLKSGLIQSLVKSKNKVGFGFKTATEKPNCFFNKIRINPGKELNVRDENLYIVKEYFKLDEGFNSIDQEPLDQEPFLKISNEQKAVIEDLLHKVAPEKLKVLVCPGSFWKNKQINRETMQQFLEKVKAKMDCSFFFAWGTLEEFEMVKELKKQFPKALILDKLTLSTLQNLMGRMDLVIAMDSLPLHLAGTTGVSTFSFFGPSSSSKFMPLGQNQHAFQGSCPYGRSITRRCPILRHCKTGACLKNSPADELFASFEKALYPLS